jgi:hypothetical protein
MLKVGIPSFAVPMLGGIAVHRATQMENSQAFMDFLTI